MASSSNTHSGRNLGTSSDRYGFIGWGSEASSFNGNGSSTHQELIVDLEGCLTAQN